jgi:geranylgeranyl pyrophosphate synthase
MTKHASPLLTSLTKFKPRIDKRLRDLFADAIARAETIDPVYATLLTVTRDQLLRSGKRLRPYLTHAAYLGCGGSESSDIMSAAVSQELFHHFLLTHDDVMDRDLVRHGGPNVLGTYYEQLRERGLPDAEAYHHAESYAVLAGNANCALGFEAILSTGFSPERKLAAVSAIQRMLFEIMGGQLMDVTVAIPGQGRPSLEQLLRICRYKSANYTFETPLRVASALAGADQSTERGLVTFGRHLGVAFQLTDDLLSTYSDEASLGKPVLSDLHEGKQTILIHYALEAASPVQAQQLQKIWGDRGATADHLHQVRELITTTGAQAKVTALADSHLSDALAALEATSLSKDTKSELTQLAHFCVSRQY